MKSEMIRLLPVYQGVDSENPYSFMRDFEDVCSAFLSIGLPLHIICMVLFPFSVTPRPDEVHSTCNCKGAYVHQVPL